MPQFYYKNGKLYVSKDNKVTIPLRRVTYSSSVFSPIHHFSGANYLEQGKNFYGTIDDTFTPVTEQQINDIKRTIGRSGKIGDKIKYLHSKVNQTLSPKKKNITVTNSSASTDSNTNSKKRTQYQPPKEIKSREDIIRIQQMLADANEAAGTNKYNLGTYGVNGNGVDGIWGSMTDAAYRDYLIDQEKPVIVPDDNVGVLPIADVQGVRIAPRPVFQPMNWRDVYDDIKAGRRDSWIDYAKQGGSITQKFKKIRKGQKGFLTSNLNKIKSGIDSELKKKNLSGIALLQHNLYEIGAFGNIDYDKAVDGTMGPRTKQALKKAKAMGYNFDVPKQDNQSKQRENYFTKELKRVKEELNSEIERRDNGHAIYLNYPNFVGESKNAIKIGDLDIGEMIGNPQFPVGHAATILIDNNGNANYYEYGRYKRL